MSAFGRAISSVPVALVVGAASSSLFATAAPGLWEVTQPGSAPVRLCVATVEILAQFQDRASTCARTIVRDDGLEATIRYSCGSTGGFGQSTVKLITPRSLTIATQGISNGAPFNYTLQARRVGDCPK
jgi:hypothetical protein